METKFCPIVTSFTLRGSKGENKLADEKYIFLGGSLALDFINTAIIVRNKPRDLLNSTTDLAKWWQTARKQAYSLVKIENGRTAVKPEDFNLAIQLRTNLRELFTAVTDGQNPGPENLAELNQTLSGGYQTLANTGEASFEKIYRLSEGKSSVILFQIAVSALELLSDADLSRLHQCQNERCILFFYDNTRSATRHWCSTACMNRSRSIKNYQAKLLETV
jgi:predicted RNA-binding Zn ribbon-like protein